MITLLGQSCRVDTTGCGTGLNRRIDHPGRSLPVRYGSGFRRLIARCQSAPQLEVDGLSRQIRLCLVFAVHFPNNDLHTPARH